MSNFENWHIQIPKEVAQTFKEMADSYGVNKSQVVRMLVKDWSDGAIRNKHNSSLQSLETDK